MVIQHLFNVLLNAKFFGLKENIKVNFRKSPKGYTSVIKRYRNGALTYDNSVVLLCKDYNPITKVCKLK